MLLCVRYPNRRVEENRLRTRSNRERRGFEPVVRLRNGRVEVIEMTDSEAPTGALEAELAAGSIEWARDGELWHCQRCRMVLWYYGHGSEQRMRKECHNCGTETHQTLLARCFEDRDGV